MNALRAATIILLPTLILSTVVLTGSQGPLQAAANSIPTARAAGIMINHAVAERENGMPALAFQGTAAQTRLALVIESPEGGIIGFSRDTSKVQSFEDSTGASLLETSSHFGPFAFGERIVQDGKRLVVSLESEQAPSPEADAISAEGTINITISHEKKKYTTEASPAEPGHGLQAGPIGMTIQSYEKSSWNDDMELSIQTEWNIDAIIGFTAILKDGSRVPLSRNSTMSFNGQTTVALGSKVDLGTSFALEVETWSNPTSRPVPFKIQAKVGLQ